MLILVLVAVRRDARLAARAAPACRRRRTSAISRRPASSIRRMPCWSTCGRRRNSKAVACRKRSTSRCRRSRAAAASLRATPGRPVVAYCMSGNRSRMAAQRARAPRLQGRLPSAGRLSGLEGRRAAGREVTAPTMTMYSTAVCPFCIQAERFLQAKGVDDIDIHPRRSRSGAAAGDDGTHRPAHGAPDLRRRPFTSAATRTWSSWTGPAGSRRCSPARRNVNPLVAPAGRRRR